MSSMYNVSPTSPHDLDDHAKNCIQTSRRADSQSKHPHNPLVTPESNFLSPFSSHARSSSASPVLQSNSPVDPATELYTTSGLLTDIDFQDDPFLGANFDHIPGYWPLDDQAPTNSDHNATYPPSPRPTPSVPGHRIFELVETIVPGAPILQKHRSRPDRSINSVISSPSGPPLTLDTHRDSCSTNDSPGEAALSLAVQSPRVMVSMWGKGDDAPILGVERSFAPSVESHVTARPAHSIAGDLAYEHLYEHISPTTRDTTVDLIPHERTGYRGLSPEERPEGSVLSPNQLEAQRQIEEKNREVDAWRFRSARGPDKPISDGQLESKPANDQDGDDNIPAGEISHGGTTENKYVNGQSYFVVDGPGGPATTTDYEYMQYRPWEDPPTLHAIQDSRFQPETSQAAMERFQRQCEDNASIISKRATWGTRRRSLPSSADIEEITTGKLLKKLHISGSVSRRPSLLQRVASLSRKTSLNHRKRKGTSVIEQPPDEGGDPVDRRESKDNPTPSPRPSSWMFSALNKMQPHPSLSGAMLAISTGAATIGAQHASPTRATSPRSPFSSLSLRRPRSKSELPKAANTENSHPNLMELLKGQGGVPVAQIARTQPQPGIEDEDDDEDDDDGMIENDIKDEQGRMNIIEPTLNGFRAHILACNPGLANTDGDDKPNGYLVERMAQQLLNRFHQLLISKQNHMKLVSHGSCPSGPLCRSIGGTTKYLGNRGGDRAADSLSVRGLSPDEENIPLEGCISADRFPRGIILPPTPQLPAEFECPLCFTVKKFQKPSDWTKHVHEDLQPFTCTWDRCREPKMFKRKADWVRHENEGHRQLEWWLCDVDECHHMCYRRDNFLQHLVREHKFVEPKIKTKVAIKRASGVDRTWQKVEQCHRESPKKPAQEPCCFCGKTMTTWKKLTVHLAKHMEQISLPILGLVMGMELDLDTVIGPVQAPLPRQSGPHPSPTPSIKPDPHQELSPHMPHSSASPPIAGYRAAPNALDFSAVQQVPVSNVFYHTEQTGQLYNHDIPPETNNFVMQAQYNPQQQYLGLPVSTAAFGPPTHYVSGMPVPNPECFPDLDSLGIQDSTGAMSFQNLANNQHGTELYGLNPEMVSSYLHHQHQSHDGQFYHP